MKPYSLVSEENSLVVIIFSGLHLRDSSRFLLLSGLMVKELEQGRNLVTFDRAYRDTLAKLVASFPTPTTRVWAIFNALYNVH